jgi:hypothetical protein
MNDSDRTQQPPRIGLRPSASGAPLAGKPPQTASGGAHV